MEIKELANAITVFCMENKIFNTTFRDSEIKKRIKEQLAASDPAFIEGLINMMFVRTRDQAGVDKRLLIELEKLRLELEYSNRKRWS